MHFGKCPNPKCGLVISKVRCEAVDVAAPDGSNWRGLSHSCHSCGTVLGVQINPYPLMQHTLDKITEELDQIKRKVDDVDHKVRNLSR